MDHKARHCPTNTARSADWYCTPQGGAIESQPALSRGVHWRSTAAVVLAALLAGAPGALGASNGDPDETALVGEASDVESATDTCLRSLGAGSGRWPDLGRQQWGDVIVGWVV